MGEEIWFVGPAGRLPITRPVPSGKSGPALLALRPDAITLSSSVDATRASVDVIEPIGPEDIVTLSLGGDPVIVPMAPNAVADQEVVGLDLDLDRAMLFEPSKGTRYL